MQFGQVKRRELISLLAGAAAWPASARAQQPAMPVIGFLSSGSADAFAHRVRAFHQGVREVGSVEGDNVVTLYRWADGQNDRLPAQADDLVRRQVAVIAAFGSIATLAVKKATATIPIVFALDEDPVRLGIVTSLSRPGGNLTGANFFANEVVAKRLELLRELVPTAKRVAVLVNPTYPASETTLREGLPAARAMGCKLMCSMPARAAMLMPPLQALSATHPTPFSLRATPSSPVDVCNWSIWCHATAFPRHSALVNFPILVR
jgi:putative ABC transport system substrate-binding protein